MKALGKAAQQELVDSLKKYQFSIIIDETTDISTYKSCAVLVKYHDEDSKRIETRFLDLLDVYALSDNESEGSTGQHLFTLITNLLSDHQIPLKNLIGFAADGASNIMGQHNSVTSRLRNEAPGITVFRCTCHSIHLCASGAAKTLPRKCEDLIRSVYTYFSHSAKRLSEFSEFQEFCQTKPHKILHVSQTRWLSLHMAVERVLEQWKPLSLYFTKKHLEDRLSASTSIHEALRDPSMLIYYQFLNFILPHFTKFNQLFQRTEPTIHLLHDKITTLYKDILRYFYLPNKINGDHLALIDPCNESNFVPLNQVYLGYDALKTMQEPDVSQNAPMVEDITKRCRQFLVTACVQIKQRFPLDSKMLQLCGALSMKNCTSIDILLKTPTLLHLVTEVPRINVPNHQKLDDEWRHIPNIDIPQEIRDTNNPEAFFTYLATITDNDNKLEFTVLPKFALSILSLPTSNADAERIFSKLNLIKTKIRNKMLTATETALAVVADTVKSQGGCIKFEPSEAMIKSVKCGRKNVNANTVDSEN